MAISRQVMSIGDLQQVLMNGLAAHKKRQFKKAEHLYEQVLEKDSQNADAWHLLGLLAHMRGNCSEARQKIQYALKLEPKFPEAFNSLGNVFADEKNFGAALKAYSHAIEIRSIFGEAFANRGDVLRCIGNLKAAEADCRKSIDLEPNLAAGYGNLATIFMDLKNWEGAYSELKKAIRLEPNEAVFLTNMAKTLVKLNRSEEALKAAELAITLCPTSADALNSLGNAHYDLLDYDAAENSYCKALQVEPEHADAHNNLGNVLAGKNQLRAAADSFYNSLKINPKRPDVLTNLGVLFQAQGRVDEALEKFDEALEVDPEYADGHWNRSLARLLTGDLMGGFEDYEWRFKVPGFSKQQRNIPLWDGQSLAEKSILIYSEQGYGDTIQFIRYAPMLVKQGAKVILETHKPLVKLFEGVKSLDEVIPRGTKAVHTDFQIPIMSLPNRFSTTLNHIPADIPYLPIPKTIDVGVGTKSQPVIGIAWAGNPRHRHSWAANRTLDITYLKPIFNISDITWVSLQMDDRYNEVAVIERKEFLHDIRGKVVNFADTAALIDKLDLVITVDTAVAHLAGAIGKPVWNLLSFAADWRWLLERNDSPWYPTMRLFRQKTPGDWEGVITSVKEALYSMNFME